MLDIVNGSIKGSVRIHQLFTFGIAVYVENAWYQDSSEWWEFELLWLVECISLFNNVMRCGIDPFDDRYVMNGKEMLAFAI